MSDPATSCGSAAWPSCSPAYRRFILPGEPPGCCRPSRYAMTEVPVNDTSTGFALEGKDLCKDFTQGGVVLQVLRGASIAVRGRERIAIVGASGSGKTTLL